ncbi:MAG: hypothetical protein MUP60_01455, partial [Candidatus Thorarchaeota archaeon]|nr:hypothetical protein [Candidatus Thorarchaeota archaeon]
MAFEDGLGTDPSQQREENYTLSAYDIMAKTISLWARKIMQYIVIGIIAAACVSFSFILLLSLFGIVGIIGSDPISYLLSLFLLPVSDLSLVFVTV